mmetsp:Transcript_45989/g.68448  ORF Transcript_45989/g.68448 Transcript_45989/m.68448 type:complete len:409 (-) Transcript_45989:334-1560(-)
MALPSRQSNLVFLVARRGALPFLLLVVVVSYSFFIVDNDPKSGSVNMNLLSSCVWSPESPTACETLLTNHICSGEEGVQSNTTKTKKAGRRMLVFGDSTNHHLFKHHPQNFLVGKLIASNVADACKGRYQCRVARGHRCRNNHLFGADYPINKTWMPPDNVNNVEGPLIYGSDHPFCTDCNGCRSQFLQCFPQDILSATTQCRIPSGDGRGIVHGGFIGVEFARDVEIQSSRYRTTQENIAAFLRNEYNQESLVEDWGRPICVINTGHHDVMIPNITKSRYVENVRWYLQLMAPQCSHIFWLETTSPRGDSEYIQSRNRTKAWNQGVKQMLSEETQSIILANMDQEQHQEEPQGRPLLRSKVAYVEVFDASVSYPHNDNIHMDPSWYRSLADMFLEVGSTRCESPLPT